jgi:hypothetical protein
MNSNLKHFLLIVAVIVCRNLESGDLLYKLEGHQGVVFTLDFDEHLIASGSIDTKIVCFLVIISIIKNIALKN